MQMNKGMLAPFYLVQQHSFLYPPLGLLYLASNIDRCKHEVKIIDSAALKFSINDCIGVVKEFKPDILGMTVLTDLLYSAKKIAEGVKSISPKTRIALGGPHINIYPHETISFPEVDFCLQHFAEYSLNALLRAIENNSGYNDVPGLFYKKNGIIYKSNRDVDKKIDLDALKIPDRRLLDYSKYFVVIDKNERITTALSSRGCPYQCTFCDVFQKEYLYRSPENLIEEVRDIVKLGIRFVHFFDDNFNLLKDRVVRFCELLLKENIKIRWAFRGRVVSIDDKMAKLLYKAGCRRVQLGIESAGQETINIIKKNINLEEAKEVVRIYKKNKISTLGYFMVGFYHENYEDCVESLNKAMRFGFDYIEFSALTPYPHTEIYQQILDKGIKDHWLEFARNPSPGYNIPGMHPTIPREELDGLIRSAYKKFYFSPNFILKELLRINNLRALTLKLKSALKILLAK